MKRLVMLGLVLLLAPWPASAAETYGPAAPVYREIGDWLIACDNTRVCVAKAAPVEGSDTAPDTPGFIAFTRAAGPAGAAKVALASETAFEPQGLRLDGKPLAAAGWTYSKADDDQELTGAAAIAFIKALRNGAVLQFGPGKDAPSASLKGLSAVLLAMDEAQGRLGNASALARPGPAPASATPAPLAPPIVHAAPPLPRLANADGLIEAVRKTQAKVLKAHECDSTDNRTDSAATLNAGEAIVVLNCTFAAYQGSVLAFRLPVKAPAQARLLALPTPPTVPAEEVEAPGEFTEGGYDAKTATFSESAKGRGPADCGTSASWVFDGQAFHLSAFNRQDRCYGEPGDWPTLYRTTVAH
jgi:hypothetical protein